MLPIPSKKAEPFKLWLAQVGRERIEEIEDPEIALDRAMETYLKKGYSKEWINQRLKSIEVRKELTDEWQERGIETNGMVERANGIIKQATIVKKTYQNRVEMEEDLIKFLVYYNTIRRHGSIQKELQVKTPFQAMIKWYELKPEIFKITPTEFKNKIVNLNASLSNFHQQPGET